MKKAIVLVFICLAAWPAQGSAQGDTTLVAKNMRLARELMDRGLYDESIALLDATDEFDPARTAEYSYERGFAQYLKGDYQAAIRSLSRAKRFRDASDSVYEMLGSCYYLTGYADIALSVYEKGLLKFPGSGRLCHATGMVYFSGGENILALDWFLEGLERDPGRADNWFSASAVQFFRGAEVFGNINGETAICLEPDSERSSMMCGQLLETWRKEIVLSERPAININFSDKEEAASPFAKAYMETLAAAVRGLSGSGTADIPLLIDIRRRFIGEWFSKRLNAAHPCVLFDYHRALIEAGHFEAYNYWLFSPGDPAAFASWRLTGGEAFDAFEAWFGQNPIIAQ